MPWVSLACKKCCATQTTWIVAKTLSPHCLNMQRALQEPATVLKKYTALTAKATGGESRRIVVEIIINNTPKIIISVYTCVFHSSIYINTGRTEKYFSQILKTRCFAGNRGRTRPHRCLQIAICGPRQRPTQREHPVSFTVYGLFHHDWDTGRPRFGIRDDQSKKVAESRKHSFICTNHNAVSQETVLEKNKQTDKTTMKSWRTPHCAKNKT